VDRSFTLGDFCDSAISGIGSLNPRNEVKKWGKRVNRLSVSDRSAHFATSIISELAGNNRNDQA
jgi:hypothetical protein